MMKRIIVFFTIFWIFIGCVMFLTDGFQAGVKPLPGVSDESRFTVTILHTNDFHGADMELLAKRATVIKKCRAESPNPVLLLDAGDVFTRGRYAKRFFGELEFEVMNHLGYDALTLGNNEFKATNDVSSAQRILSERIRQARFPVLGANVVHAKTNQYITGVSPYILKEFPRVTMAIFGVTTNRAATYSQLAGLKILDPIEVSRQMVRGLAGKADIIIALTHIGIDEDLMLGEKTPGITAIIGGDSHTYMMTPEWAGQCPIVHAGSNGRYIGRLDLTFTREDTGWRLKNTEWGLINLYNEELKPDPDVIKIIERYLAKPLKKAS